MSCRPNCRWSAGDIREPLGQLVGAQALGQLVGDLAAELTHQRLVLRVHRRSSSRSRRKCLGRGAVGARGHRVRTPAPRPRWLAHRDVRGAAGRGGGDVGLASPPTAAAPSAPAAAGGPAAAATSRRVPRPPPGRRGAAASGAGSAAPSAWPTVSAAAARSSTGSVPSGSAPTASATSADGIGAVADQQQRQRLGPQRRTAGRPGDGPRRPPAGRPPPGGRPRRRRRAQPSPGRAAHSRPARRRRATTTRPGSPPRSAAEGGTGLVGRHRSHQHPAGGAIGVAVGP